MHAHAQKCPRNKSPVGHTLYCTYKIVDILLSQVTTVTKVVREVSHMEPDPGAVSYMSVPLMQDYQHTDSRYPPADPYMVSFDHYDPYMGYPSQPGYPGPHGIYMPRSHSPHSPHSPSEHSRASPPHGMYTLHMSYCVYKL